MIAIDKLEQRARAIACDALALCHGKARNHPHHVYCRNLAAAILQAMRDSYKAGQEAEAAMWKLKQINQELGLD